MKNSQYKMIIFLMAFSMFFYGCATIPKETVELSYAIGQDLDAVHASYTNLIHKHFDNLRNQTNDFLDKKWTPTYLNKFIKKGNLISLAQDPDPVKAFDGVSTWAEIAIKAIENKKKELISPINDDEQNILKSVDDAFARIMRANAAITAQLNSIRKVQEVQDDALKALNIKDLRDQINSQLISASNKAVSAMDQVAKAENAIPDIDAKKQEIINKIKGEK
jgi:hypothetical protein